MKDGRVLDQAEFDRWRAMALDALEAADSQLERSAHHWACFLAEQAGQFICKGLLHGLGLPAWGHDLTELGRRLFGETDLALDEAIADALARLSRHYIATRYPDAHPAGTPAAHFRRSDAERAVADAKAVIAFLEQHWQRLAAESAQWHASGGDSDAQ